MLTSIAQSFFLGSILWISPQSDLEGKVLVDRLKDPLPPEAVARLGSRRLQHEELITFLILSPDGTKLCSGSRDQTVRVWDAVTGQALLDPIHLGDPVVSGNFSSDGTRLVVGTREKNLVVLDVETGTTLRILSQGGHLGAFSPDGKILAGMGVDRRLSFFDAGSGRLIRAHDELTYIPRSAGFSPDGTVLAVLELNRDNSLGRKGVVDEDPDAKISVWSPESGQKIREIPFHLERPHSMTISPKGSLAATASNRGLVSIWDLQTGKELHTLRGHSGEVFFAAFSPDGKSIASAGADRKILLWDVQTGEEAGSLQIEGVLPQVLAFLAQGKRIAAAAGASISLHSLGAERDSIDLQRHRGAVSGLRYSSDGQSLVTGSYDRTVRVWDASSQRCRTLHRGHEGLVNSVVFTRDAKQAISASQDGTVRFWDTETGTERAVLEGFESAVMSVDVSPDGKWLAVTAGNGVFSLWDISDRKQIWKTEAQPGMQFLVRFSPNGAVLATTGADLRFRRVSDGQEISRVEGLKSPVTAIDFSPDGSTFAVGFADRSIRLWETGSGKVKGGFEGHTGRITSLAFSPHGDCLASAASSDPKIRLWDLRSGEAVRVFQGHIRDVLSLAFSPTGKFLASGGADTTVLIWSVDRD